MGIGEFTHSCAERRGFARLAATPLPGASCYDSLALSLHDYKRAAEIDFLIVSLAGIYVLEVMGGGVRCQNGDN